MNIATESIDLNNTGVSSSCNPDFHKNTVVYKTGKENPNSILKLAHESLKIKTQSTFFGVVGFSKMEDNRTSIPLSHKFEKKSRVNLTEQDVLSQSTFKELILENSKEGLPYFITLTKDKNGHVAAFDTALLLKYINEYGTENSPTTKQPFTKAIVYGITSIHDAGFTRLCKFSELRDQIDRLAKVVLASFQDQQVEVRADRRFFVGLQLEGNGDIEQAEQWYKLAAQDKSVGALLHLYTMYTKKANEYVATKIKAIQCLQLAWENCSDEKSKNELENVLREELTKFNQSLLKSVDNNSKEEYSG